MKYLTLLISAALIAGCATGYNPSYVFKRVDVVNLSGDTLKDLTWNVIGSGKTMTCSEVPANGICADYFATRRYPKAGIEVSWTQGDGERKKAIINPNVPAFFYASLPLMIFVEIGADGSLNAYYDQDTPDGGRIFIRH